MTSPKGTDSGPRHASEVGEVGDEVLVMARGADPTTFDPEEGERLARLGVSLAGVCEGSA